MAMSNLIDAQNVRKIYDQDDVPVEAVSMVNFGVRAGEFVSILGPSGCGKSTLLMMVAGLESSTGGSISIGGATIQKPRQNVSVVFQDAVLLPWKSVLENTLFPVHIQGRSVDAYRDRAQRLLDSVGLRDFADKRPHQQSGNRYCRKGKECPGDSYGKPIGIKRCKTKCRDGGRCERETDRPPGHTKWTALP